MSRNSSETQDIFINMIRGLASNMTTLINLEVAELDPTREIHLIRSDLNMIRFEIKQSAIQSKFIKNLKKHNI
jgi:hypothetical protein